ncbi:hypothetical protein [Rhodococcus tukisamuensis]|uniref:Adenylate cyclase n=1 Tax=Rhodococcus tukisamuensis TaxID=168276 RepID=A0A1G6ZBE7_9NOCA|nr:hypothetical protein [Rhodococcus tukisamuensis]SDD99195.1 hypothetical protein SAMN05444580_108156 [Rhodococcus tukisamuensis]
MEILVAFAYAVVVVTIAVVLIGVTMLFIVSINENFGQRKPKDSFADLDRRSGRSG